MNSVVIFLFLISSCFGSLSNQLKTIPAEIRILSNLQNHGPKKAAPTTFPYVVAIHVASTGAYNCGGSIIDSKWILTTASCIKRFKSPSELFVLTGAIVTHGGKGRRYKAAQLYKHPDFHTTPKIVWHDIGLIKLRNSIQWDPYVLPIKLGSINAEREVPVVAVGWGSEYYNDNREKRTLNYATLKTVKSEKCKNIHAEASNIVDKASQICAIHGYDKSMCAGDAGGPLVDIVNGKLVGVFSALEDCSGIYPSIFSKVSHYLPWIREKTSLSL